MEETVGKIWHRLISGAAAPGYPHAAVQLKDIEHSLGIGFRALGGDPGLRVAGSALRRHGAHRKLLARFAGTDEKFAPAHFADACLRLPPRIAAFAERKLNEELYRWLAALAATSAQLAATMDEFTRNQLATRLTLSAWPGLTGRYRRLVAAHLAQRDTIACLPETERGREAAIRQALETPGSVASLPEAPRPARPVPLWLLYDNHVAAEPTLATRHAQAEMQRPNSCKAAENKSETHKAERITEPAQRNGLLMRFRAESLLTLGEYMPLNRPQDDEPDHDAANTAHDLDRLSLSGDGQTPRARVRFDLDLPSSAEDDIVLGPGIALPEWDFRKSVLLPDHVRIIEMAPRGASNASLPPQLVRTAERLRQQFSALLPERRFAKGQPDGAEIDVDAIVRAASDRRSGRQPTDHLYQCPQRRGRNLACLVLADLSMSTDTWVSNDARVIDVIRDALLLLGTALSATGDRFALCGFSSLRRNHVRFGRLKDFTQPFGAAERGSVQAIKPGYYTRLGAAIRHASQLLEEQAATQRLLLILSDGKPNDLDLYEGRYGFEDTRMAIISAKQRGLTPYCVTIDRDGLSYLPHLFGPRGYAVIRRPEELPQRLPQLYAELTMRH